MNVVRMFHCLGSAVDLLLGSMTIQTRDRAVRMYQERRRDVPEESAIKARKRVGELLDVKPETLRDWIERVEVDAAQRPGVPSAIGQAQGASAGER